MKITKKHKLYVRLKSDSDSVSNLAKKSPALFLFVLNYMSKQVNIEAYQNKNSKVTSWNQYKAIDVYLDEKHSFLLSVITKKKELVVYYNGSWQPVVNLIPTKQSANV